MSLFEKISVQELKELSEKMFDNLVKGVVDIEEKKVVFDMEMHVDGEQMLLELGSYQKSLWGINLYPDYYGTENFIEYDSMINIRPSQNNPSRSVQDDKIRKKIEEIIAEVVYE